MLPGSRFDACGPQYRFVLTSSRFSSPHPPNEAPKLEVERFSRLLLRLTNG